MSNEIDHYRGNAEELLQIARSEGLNPVAVDIMHDHLDNITIAGGRGEDTNNTAGDGVVLVTLILDESSSMSGVATIVRQCYTDLVGALSELAGGWEIQLSTWVFNDQRKLLNSFKPARKVSPLFSRYSPSGLTALYDTTLSALTGQVIYSHKLWEAAKQTKNIVIVISDGGDNSSIRDKDGNKTKELAQTLLVQGDYILAYIGLGPRAPLPESACRILADCIGFNEILSVGKTQQDLIDLFNKIVFAIKRVSDSTDLVRTGSFFGQ